jgi:N-acyl-D-aspartate/D-glutamate deacylase
MPTGALAAQIGWGSAGIVAEAVTADAFRQALENILAHPEVLKGFSDGAGKLLTQRDARSEWIRLVEQASAGS